MSKTVILATLDEPLPQGKNVIWCASFQMAWDRLASDVLRQPPQIRGAEALCNRLNQAAFPGTNACPNSCYAAAGFVNDGIVETIVKQIKSRFPSVPPPTLTSAQDGIIAYAYLSASLKFAIPFFDNRSLLRFQDSSGAESSVTAFGIRHEDDYAYYDLRKQVDVLHGAFDHHAYKDGYRKAWYAVDPCKHSTPLQIVLARTPPQHTLAETLSQLAKDIDESSKAKCEREFGPNDVLLIPTQSWSIKHHFKNLEGTDKRLQNAGFQRYYVAEALQTVEFRLDRGGAELKSASKMFCAPVPRYFIFDAPFLVYMKVRGAEKPFFVMWVENSELLSPFSG